MRFHGQRRLLERQIGWDLEPSLPDRDLPIISAIAATDADSLHCSEEPDPMTQMTELIIDTTHPDRPSSESKI
ncbi:uncharacterized protein ColSpa_06929 [Colletotrichum spaethianum]|uniref:Uncharacterized protein n=1 Tax=Colletotrichum spaethianum TaxID=700344 RepID=A0AA37P2M7_9PEZI|nr:uncharacterized protein ColSpa_06929 [Colletotrichum spaethianum]GKT46748.1 hypothetical protein ColSpa_06929 [Colletotrichum spaethianum]